MQTLKNSDPATTAGRLKLIFDSLQKNRGIVPKPQKETTHE